MSTGSLNGVHDAIRQHYPVSHTAAGYQSNITSDHGWDSLACMTQDTAIKKPRGKQVVSHYRKR